MTEEKKESQFIGHPEDEELPMIIVRDVNGRNLIGGFGGLMDLGTIPVVYPLHYIEEPQPDGKIRQGILPIYHYRPLLEVLYVNCSSYFMLESAKSEDLGLTKMYYSIISKLKASATGIIRPSDEEVSKLGNVVKLKE